VADPYADAERLVRAAQEAAQQMAAAASAEEPPPRGWSTPADGRSSPFPDLSAVFGLVDTLKGTIPPELLHQLTDALRDLLLALRAIIDYSIARLDRTPAEAVEVEDIPVE
jgi:hypothetical protein